MKELENERLAFEAHILAIDQRHADGRLLRHTDKTWAGSDEHMPTFRDKWTQGLWTGWKMRAATEAPATAPERPNPYDACESFKAYQLSCRREAVLQKEIERLLAAPATAPDELERLRWAIKDALEQLQRGDLADAESTLSDAAKGTP